MQFLKIIANRSLLQIQVCIFINVCLFARVTNPGMHFHQLCFSYFSGSTALIKTSLVDGKRVFERVYICLKACVDGFNKGCRPLLGFDGCFLKGYTKGMLLAAIGIDSNNSLFPVAYAVVEKENTQTWTWFMLLLKEDLGVQNTHGFTMVTDRQKGLEKALSEIFPGSEHRFCVRHLHSNFKKDHPRLLLK